MDNIILCGFMGSGKTTVGKELARKMNFKFIDTDELIEKEQGITIKEIFEKHGEDYFRNLEHEICKKVSDMRNCIISTGGGVMTYKRNCDVLKNKNKIIFLDASFNIICKRIGNSNVRPLFKDLEKAKQLYDERKKKYVDASDYIVNGDMSVEETVLEIGGILK